MKNKVTSNSDRRTTINYWLLSNMRSRGTGVEGTIIWISCGEFGGPDHQHGPRIVVALGDKIDPAGLGEAASVLLADPPEVLGTLPEKVARQAVEFASKNRDVLLRHWRGETDTREMCDLIEKV